MVNQARNLVLVVMVLALWAASASAAIIEIALTADVTEVDDAGGLLEGQINTGDRVTGSYTYDSDAPDSNPLTTIGEYQHSSPPYGISLSVGGFVFESDPDNVDFLMGIHNNHDGRDVYGFASYNNLQLSNGVHVDHISWQLFDYSGNAVSSTALPTIPPVLEDWEHVFELGITFGDKGSCGLGAQVTSVELVPEPAAVLLLGLGALATVARRTQSTESKPLKGRTK